MMMVCTPDGIRRRMLLEGAHYTICDAVRKHRFVRHLSVVTSRTRVDFITPPEQGTIAPRVADLPQVPAALVVDKNTWEAIRDWVKNRGRLSGCTIAQLAKLACIASAQFAIAIGERAAVVAVQMAWDREHPMRKGVDVSLLLKPLEEAARYSSTARDALLAAFSRAAV